MHLSRRSNNTIPLKCEADKTDRRTFIRIFKEKVMANSRRLQGLVPQW